MAGAHILFVRSGDTTERFAAALTDAGCTVTSVETATAALATLSTAEFDCLVTTSELPGDSGIELLSAVEQIAPSLPTIVLSSVDDESISTAAFEQGANSYIRQNGEVSVEKLVTETKELNDTPHQEPKQDISGHEPSDDELVQAINEAPIGISLSDSSLTDYPLVYVNNAWKSFTGYETDEILGRNPRLLQGPETDAKTIETLSEAIANEESISREIRNYRKDGTPFWNELTIAPIHDDTGELVHYVGFQIDVTDRRAAEELAEERSRKLAEERLALRRILSRVNGLLSEVSRVLVEETDRQVIEHHICAQIAAEPGYTAAWIGTVDATTQQFSITAHSGFDGGPPAEIEKTSLPAAVSRAIETDETHCSADDDADSALDPRTVGARSLLAVPLCYGDRRYGILGVYGSDTDALDQRDQQVFSSLGTMIANGLHAVETTRILTTDQVTELQIELFDPAFHLTQIATQIGSNVERCGTTRSTDGDAILYLTTNASAVDLAELTALPFVTDARLVSETDSELTFSVTSSSATPYDELAEYGAIVTAATATAAGAELTVEAPPEQDVRTLLDVLRSLYGRVELRARTQRDRRSRRPTEFSAAVDEQLTERQRAALEAAQLNGYFEWPRPVDGSEIAETMDITRQTFHQHLRAAEQKLVTAYLDA